MRIKRHKDLAPLLFVVMERSMNQHGIVARKIKLPNCPTEFCEGYLIVTCHVTCAMP